MKILGIIMILVLNEVQKVRTEKERLAIILIGPISVWIISYDSFILMELKYVVWLQPSICLLAELKDHQEEFGLDGNKEEGLIITKDDPIQHK